MILCWLSSTSGRGLPEWVGGVDAEDLHVGGEEAQLLERALDAEVLRMAVDLGEELAFFTTDVKVLGVYPADPFRDS